jgi:hypothetical protein
VENKEIIPNNIERRLKVAITIPQQPRPLQQGQQKQKGI